MWPWATTFPVSLSNDYGTLNKIMYSKTSGKNKWQDWLLRINQSQKEDRRCFVACKTSFFYILIKVWIKTCTNNNTNNKKPFREEKSFIWSLQHSQWKYETITYWIGKHNWTMIVCFSSLCIFNMVLLTSMSIPPLFVENSILFSLFCCKSVFNQEDGFTMAENTWIRN